MKWNWGTKLVVAMAAFMIMIIVLVILMFQEKVELVEADYYPKGQNYQQHIDEINRTDQLPQPLDITYESGVVTIIFPYHFNPDSLSGEVSFYNRSESEKDLRFELKPDSLRTVRFDVRSLHGRYLIQIEWKYNNLGYFKENPINFPLQ